MGHTRCDACREAVSARLDGEDPGLPEDQVDAHLAVCGACRTYAAEAAVQHRLLRLSPAVPVPDLTASVLSAIGSQEPDWEGRRQVMRWTLAAVAVVQLLVALPALLLGGGSDLPTHAARHLGSFDVALAVGLLYAAWRPSRLGALLPVALTLAGCLSLTSVLDLAAGRTAGADELHHLPALVGVALAWLLAHPDRPGRRVPLPM
ncbi:MAG: zf-HC2 domain-containing protein [Acidimicrobiia bacterium]|nr:zf-HC2 domain-containing protein [Acidimicrobiia bacterium]